MGLFAKLKNKLISYPSKVNTNTLDYQFYSFSAMQSGEKKGEPPLTPPFAALAEIFNLELISPIQVAVQPATTTPDPAIMVNTEVSLHGSGQVGSVIPQQASTDAHPRGYEVPQIPLS